jgi:hypothetical protein
MTIGLMDSAMIVRKARRIDDGAPLMLWVPSDHEAAGYAVQTAVCANPDCPCTEMTLDIHRVTRLEDGQVSIGDAVLGGHVSFDGTGVRLDGANAALKSEAIAWLGEQLVQESHRAWLEERWRRRRGQVGDPAYPSGIPPEVPEGLVFFSDVFPYDFDLIVVDDRRIYLADDQYCLEPACTCDDITVQFIDLQDGGGPIGYVQASSRRFDAPRVHGSDRLRRLWRKLLDEYGAEHLRERFRRMRHVVRRRAQDDSASSTDGQHVARGTKVGRNASCPCGSGKKFKHCCGA